MSKLSRTFQPPPPARLGVRLVLMSVILLVALGTLTWVRHGILGRSAEPEPAEPGAPADAPSETAPLAARVNAGNGKVELQLSAATAQTPAPTPPTAPNDNTPLPSSATADDVFDNVLDGHHILWKERHAYNHVVAMAWDLGPKEPTDPSLRIKQIKLLADPKTYRAKLIRVKGSLLRVRQRTFDPDENHPDRPLVHYECAIKSIDEDPWMVLVFEDPASAGARAGRDVVWTDAYFFKIWGYNDGKMKAPLLMGYRVHKLEPRNVLGPMASLVLGGFVALVILLWLWLRRGRYQSEVLRQRLAREDTEDIDIPEPASLPRDEEPESRPREP